MLNRTGIKLLDIEDVLHLHEKLISKFGGMHGLRDRGLLESAVSQPVMTAFGQYLHPDIFLMAAAYCFHLIANHPFIDGNKRIGLLAAIVFLEKNGYSFELEEEITYQFIIAIAESKKNKEEIAEFFRENCTELE